MSQKYTLLVNDVQHGHPHDGNFNLRWLLQDDKGGGKEVIFDPNIALQRAYEEELSITPIVTLRDWDQGFLVKE